MRYFRTVDEGYHRAGVNWGGNPTYWLEVNDRGHADRELQVYPNGNVLRYDREHPGDEYGALSLMVVDGDEDSWVPFAITRDEFEQAWRAHPRFIRGAEPPTAPTL
jgi:hypothetical protein